nr:short-chain dehydrogenase [Bacillus sp. EB01]
MHALVIGGTGMLSKVSLWLVNEGYNLSVIGRNPQRMNQLINASKKQSRITPLLIDYHNDIQLKEQLKMTIKKNGPIELVVAWIHSTGKNALNVISQELSSEENSWRLFHVLGSSSDLDEIKNNTTLPSNCLYRQVQLGFIVENDYSRWLTHDEICKGIKESLVNDEQVKIVGTIEPWDERP